jgi:hypothetical protein
MKTLNHYKLLTVFSLFAICASSAMADSVTFPVLPVVTSTVPANGDVNPYGVAFIPENFPTPSTLSFGDLLVSNFNNSNNLQGTGTTIVSVTPSGATSTFFQSSLFPGLTAALGVLSKGLVIVGNLPTADGTAATVGAGSLLVINANGRLLASINTKIDGPWGLAIREIDSSHAQIFVSNVLNGTVVRFDALVGVNSLTVTQAVTIGSGFNHRTDPAALVLGPSGLIYEENEDLLLVVSSLDNAVYGISNASKINKDVASGTTGTLLLQDTVHLHGPLDVVQTANGHFLVANSDGSNVDPNQPSEIVEYSVTGNTGEFVQQFSVDPNNGGAFGLTLSGNTGGGRIAYVDDNQNNVTITGIVAK